MLFLYDSKDPIFRQNVWISHDIFWFCSICTDCYPTSTFNISIIENNLGGEHVSKMNDGDDSGEHILLSK